MNMKRAWYGWMLGALVLAGCSPLRRETYEFTVHNQTARPLTLWLTKDGPPYEAKWESPEELATQWPVEDDSIPMVVVAPQATLRGGPIQGHFDRGVRAILRIYAGSRTFKEVLAFGPEDRDRLDVALRPGRNDLVVTEQAGRLKAIPAPPSVPAP
jgi:hypothetical protein